MDKVWTVGHCAEGHAVIKHDDYGNIPAWNDVTASAIALILNQGPSEVGPLSTEAEGDAYMHGWFDGYDSKLQIYSSDEYDDHGEVLIFGEQHGVKFKHVAVRVMDGADPFWRYKTSLGGYNTVEDHAVVGFQLINIPKPAKK